jgi:hypothetical protein
MGKAPDQPTDIDPKEALARAQAARIQFRAALDQARERIAPASLRAEAGSAIGRKVDETRRTVENAARQHPLLTAVGAAAVAGVVARWPAVLFGKMTRKGAWQIWKFLRQRRRARD